MTKEQYESVRNALTEAGDWPREGCLLHVCFGDEQDIRVSEVWESQEQLDAFGETLRPKLEAAGVELAGPPDVLEAHLVETFWGRRPGRARSARACSSAMSPSGYGSLGGMSNPTQVPTTISNIGVAMFTIADQDAAIAYYTQTLGWELRADVRFGDEGGYRWVEVAPPGSVARLALNPPMGGQPGGGGVGVETPDIEAEHARVTAIEGVTSGEMIGGEGPVPRMFSIQDPDGNQIWVVQPT